MFLRVPPGTIMNLCFFHEFYETLCARSASFFNLSFGVPLSSWTVWSSSPSVLGSVELVSIMAEFSCYCQSCGRNSISCLTLNSLHPLLEADEVSGEVMVGGQYHMTSFSVVQTHCSVLGLS